MSAVRRPFQPSDNPALSSIKTIFGLILTLGLIAMAVIFMLMNPVYPVVDQQKVTFSEQLYVSGITGSVDVEVISTGEETGSDWEAVQAGYDLPVGRILRTANGSRSIIRSVARNIEIMLDDNSTLSAGDTLDPSLVTLISGNAIVRTGLEPDDEVTIGIGQLLIKMAGNGFLRMSRAQGSIQCALMSGSATLLDGETTLTLAAGDTATKGDGPVQVAHKPSVFAPRLVLPASGSIISKTAGTPLEIEIRWDYVENAASYRLEIARDLFFKDLIASRTTESNQLTLNEPALGRFYWRVIPIGADGTAGEISKAQPFTVRAKTDSVLEPGSAPELEITEAESQSNLVSLKGYTEPGARVIVFLEAFGQVLTEPREILVNPNGYFSIQLQAPERGELRLVVQSFYRQDMITQKSATLFVDF